MVDTHFTALASFAIELIGKNGGIRLNTTVFDENEDLQNTLMGEEIEKLECDQIISIGIEGQPITKKQVETFLEQLNDYINQEVFANDKVYTFCGIEEDSPTEYHLDWYVNSM